jgi:hypothetical protein
MLSHNPFELQTKGIGLLPNYTSNQSLEKEDTFIEDIIAEHNGFKKVLDLTQERISDDVSEQLRYLKKNEPWIADLLLGKLNNPKMVVFLFLNVGYYKFMLQWLLYKLGLYRVL